MFQSRDHNATTTRPTVVSACGSSPSDRPTKGRETAKSIVREFQRANENVPGFFVDAVMQVGHKRDHSDPVSPKTPTTICSTMVSDTSSIAVSPGAITPKRVVYEPFVPASGTPTKISRSSLGGGNKEDPFLSGGITPKAPLSASGNGEKVREAKRSGRLLTSKEFDYSVLDDFYKNSAGKYCNRHRESSSSAH